MFCWLFGCSEVTESKTLEVRDGFGIRLPPGKNFIICLKTYCPSCGVRRYKETHLPDESERVYSKGFEDGLAEAAKNKKVKK